MPGLGLALELAARKTGTADVAFLSLEKNRTYGDFAGVPFPVFFYDAPPISKNPGALLKFPFRFMRALRSAMQLMRARNVDCVIGMGGYSIFPGIVAARLLRVPYYLCEQNAVPGRATRLFAGGARHVFLNFPVADQHKTAAFAPEHVTLVGNPLRPALRKLAAKSTGTKKKTAGKKPAAKKSAAKKKTTERKRKLKVLVLGGSQGAAQINAMVAAAVPELRKDVAQWIVQCGEKNLESMRALLPERANKNVQLLGYHPGIAEFYKQADVLVARAGAGVLSEALAFALPMILIPYPFAADNHQLANAEYLREAGVAHCIRDRSEDPAELIRVLTEWSARPETELTRRAALARELARPDAASEIVTKILGDLPA